MREEFVKETKIFDKTEEEHKQDLLNELEASRKRLNAFHENMNFAKDSLVDYYTYQIKAEEAKYGYLLKRIKENNGHGLCNKF